MSPHGRTADRTFTDVALLNRISARDATLLLDVQPGTRFPAHHHDGAEECYVISGSVFTLGCRLGPGDFVHADGGTDHAELEATIPSDLRAAIEASPRARKTFRTLGRLNLFALAYRTNKMRTAAGRTRKIAVTD